MKKDRVRSAAAAIARTVESEKVRAKRLARPPLDVAGHLESFHCFCQATIAMAEGAMICACGRRWLAVLPAQEAS